MSDIRPGDVVVCVDAKPHPCTSNRGMLPLKRGTIYRVAREIETAGGTRGVLLVGERPHTCSCHYGVGGWLPARFRKIDAPDTEISRLIKACNPIRHREMI